MENSADRYVSFCGIECDLQAKRLIKHVKKEISALEKDNRWRLYFEQKFEQQEKMRHDDLFYVGAQMNTLYAFFDEINDEGAKSMLWKLEMECC